MEKINLVENAARTLGFKLNVQAKQLRQGHSRRVVMLVPRMNMKSYCDLFMGMSSVLKEPGFETDIYYSNNLPHDEEQLLKLIMASNPTAVVVVSSFLKNSGIFQGDIPFIFVDHHVDHMPPKAKYVSFDYIRAGTEIGEACAGAANAQAMAFVYSVILMAISGVGILLLFLHILRQMMIADKQRQLSDRHEECEADRFAAKFINDVLQFNNERNDHVMKKCFIVLTYPRIMSIL